MTNYALLIGIDDYDSIAINRLNFAAADAQAMAGVLSTGSKHRFPRDDQVLLLNKDASRERIIREFSKFAEIVHEEDMFLFYFAGHGYSQRSTKKGNRDDKLRKYIITVDVDVNSIDATAIDFPFLTDRLGAVPARRLISIFDCCYSGAAGGRTLFPHGVRAEPNDVGTEYLEKLSGVGRVVITACTGQEVAAEESGHGHGLFTYQLLEGLRGAADYKRDRIVDLDELWMYAQERTASASNGRQNPIRAGYVEGAPIYLRDADSSTTAQPRDGSLSQTIIRRYSGCKLKEVRVSEDDDTSSIGAAAAKYLEETLRSSTKIGVSCGRTLIETISQMSRSNPFDIEIFPLNGSPTDEVHLSDAMVLSYLLWSRFEPDGARAHIVPTGVPAALFEKVEEGVAEVANGILRKATGAEVFLFGIGTPTDRNRNILHLLESSGLTRDELAGAGVVGEINYQLYDSRGRFLSENPDLSESLRKKMSAYGTRFFALSTKDLRELTQRPGLDLVCVAGGTDKRHAIAAAIRGHFVRTLVTDAKTAEWLATEASC